MTLFCCLFGGALLVNAATMLLLPTTWYAAVPGVAESGPLNLHFVRDIGLVYAVCGAALMWRALDGRRAWPAALAAAAFLAGHAVLHALESLSGHHASSGFMADLLGVYLPAVLATWLAVPRSTRCRVLGTPPGTARSPMHRLLHRQIDVFEQRFGYDAGYMHEIADTSVVAALRFGAVAALAADRGAVPVAAWYAVKITVALHEDCGPCAQLTVTMAEQDGVAADVITAVIGATPEVLDADAALGVRYAAAVLARTPEVGELAAAVTARWGRPALIRLGLAIAATRTFPAVRYALGYGQACTRLRVGDRNAEPVLHEIAAPVVAPS